MLTVFIGVFLSSLLGLFFLSNLKKSKIQFLKKYFVIYSGKSTSAALLLGGLPIGLVITLSVIGLKLYRPIYALSTKMTIAFGLCSSLIIFYGLMDDKFELRPIVKLFAQTISIVVFSIVTAIDIGGVYSTIVFLFLSFYGMGVINGTNLLDGLDLMTVKLSSLTYVGYLVIAFYSNSHSTLMYSTICLAALLPFAIFNKFPSKMHLGEIGGAYLGFSYLLLFSSLFRDIQMNNSFIDAFALSVLPMTISMTEVGVSFARRTFNGKSPFKGDKFHLHHILRNYYNYSVNKTTWFLAISYGLMLFSSIIISEFTNINKTLLYCLVISMFCLFQHSMGSKYWFKKSKNSSLSSFLTSLRKNKVDMIDNSKVDSFVFKIVEINKPIEEESDDAKKAA